MCQSIDILDGRELNTIKELEEYLGGEEAIRYAKGVVIPKEKDVCLCPVDIELTFKKLGKRLVKSVWGYEEKI